MNTATAVERKRKTGPKANLAIIEARLNDYNQLGLARENTLQAWRAHYPEQYSLILERLAKEGVFFDYNSTRILHATRVRRGKCHSASVEYYREQANSRVIMVGVAHYANWVVHTWIRLKSDQTLYETTGLPYHAYFGVPLTEDEAETLWLFY